MLRASFLGQAVLTERAVVSFFPSLPASHHAWLPFSHLDQPSFVFPVTRRGRTPGSCPWQAQHFLNLVAQLVGTSTTW
jgi:hypothetical protein